MRNEIGSIEAGDQPVENIFRDFDAPYFAVPLAGGASSHGRLRHPRLLDQSAAISGSNISGTAHPFQFLSSGIDNVLDPQFDLGAPGDPVSWTASPVVSRQFSRTRATQQAPELFLNSQLPREMPGQLSPAELPRDAPSSSTIRDLSFALRELSTVSDALIRHFRTHTCHLMMPILAPSQNPWLTFYLPTALKEPATPSTICLLHALLAVAAFNKAELSSREKTAFRLRGLEHKSMAENLLRSIVEDLETRHTATHDITDKQSLLAAALTMTSIEVGCSYFTMTSSPANTESCLGV